MPAPLSTLQNSVELEPLLDLRTVVSSAARIHQANLSMAVRLLHKRHS